MAMEARTTFDELKIGDRVSHDVCGAGTVVKKDDAVHVQYDHIGKSGRNWRGEYDRGWFRHAACRLVRISE
jgi:hypothetical protein